MFRRLRASFLMLLSGGIVIAILISIFSLGKVRWNHSKEFIATTFPLLSDAVVCNWKSGTIDGGRAAGPSSIWVMAFVKMDLTDIGRAYNWVSIDYTPIKIEESPLFDGSSRNWAMSADFNADLFFPSYVGDAFVDFEHSLVYLYAETV